MTEYGSEYMEAPEMSPPLLKNSQYIFIEPFEVSYWGGVKSFKVGDIIEVNPKYDYKDNVNTNLDGTATTDEDHQAATYDAAIIINIPKNVIKEYVPENLILKTTSIPEIPVTNEPPKAVEVTTTKNEEDSNNEFLIALGVLGIAVAAYYFWNKNESQS